MRVITLALRTTTGEARLTRIGAWSLGLVILALSSGDALWALDPPVLNSTYRMEQTVEQDKDEEVFGITDVRHTYAVAATVRQSLGDHATVTAPLRLTTTRSDIKATMAANVTFQPRLDLALGDIDLGTVLILHSSGVFGGQVRPRLRAGDVTVTGLVEPRFELPEDPGDHRQIYTAALGLGFRASDALRLGVRYSGTARFALGDGNKEDPHFTHSFTPRLDMNLTDGFDLGTELIFRYASDPNITVGGHLQPRLRVGDFVVSGSVGPAFVIYTDEPQDNHVSTTASLGLTYTRDAVRVSTTVGGSLLFAIGEISTRTTRVSHFVDLSLQVDLAEAQ